MPGAWELEHAQVYRWSGDRVSLRAAERMTYPVAAGLEHFVREDKPVETQSMAELQESIRTLKLAGKATRVDLLEAPWSRWADALADDLEFMVPGTLGGITRLDVYVWGHHMVIPYPGFLTGEARRALCRPLGRITFAHSDRNGMPSFELAARAGHDAAHEALALVRGPGA